MRTDVAVPRNRTLGNMTTTAGDRIRWYVSIARLAPSKHNMQPWQFAVDGRAVELYADATRALRDSDPDDRELTIGCGAALRTYVIAVRSLGYEPIVELLPDGPSGPLARVTEGARLRTFPGDQQLLAAVQRRHTNRGPLDATAMTARAFAPLQRAAEEQGAVLQLVTAPDAREALDSLGERATRAGADQPQPAVIWTSGDTQVDWLRAGQALQSALLTGVLNGISAAMDSSPLERPATRLAVRREVGYAGFPQVVLRLGAGHSDQEVATPRRSVNDLVS